ncbi:MAG: hypothetical protein UDB11_00470 [Peptococcaceae bacterium]|nr:hypothetical protein [Peptococcaceae bacterium]
MQKTENYDDIINLSRPTSKTYPKMPPSKRAAQFAAVTMVKLGDLDVPEVADYGSWDEWYGDQTDIWCD